MVDTPVVIVPGWTGSGPEHWQTLWLREHPEWRRVEQEDWDHPLRTGWIAALEAAVAQAGTPPVLVGHSLGALLVSIWAAESARPNAAGALLVAPPDVDRPDTLPELASFAPIPRVRLPFPTIIAASRNDPYLEWTRAVELAHVWGAELWDGGAAGHLNTESGLGSWPDGQRLLKMLLERSV